jgi:glycosyltransferase involved in cell wall biosynthesis
MVSICILNWNRVETLIQSIKVLRNLKIENEILIFDQNSKDGSVEFIKSLKGVKSILSPVNVGNSISRNQMIKMAKYDYVFLLDSDIVPIENSIESLYEFMVKNKPFSFVGYDYQNYSTDPSKVVRFEKGITLKDVKTNIRIALTQYGIFRKSDLLKCPFPSFFPFDQEGWGAEDDLVGMAIVDNNLGLTGMVTGRTYYHNFPKSSWNYIEDEVHRLYALRYIVYRYFDWFLSAQQKIEVLNSGKLPITKLDLIKYHWEVGENWGDVATDWAFKEYFPFFNFNKDSENLLFFGGSIIEHYTNATKKFNKKFTNLYMFGVGIVNDTFKVPDIDFKIYPRGYASEKILKKHGVNTNTPVGDVLQLLSLIPLTEPYREKTLVIQDVFEDMLISEEGDTFKISKQIPNVNKSATFLDFFEFLESTNSYNSITSSQIHPYFYYISAGRAANLIVKDLRAEDLRFFSNLKWNSKHQDSLQARVEMQKKIPLFVDTLFKMLKKFTVLSKQRINP